MAITAAAIFPMIALVGGGVDMARMYAVRARLQAACDAGALTGRRVMGTGQWADYSYRANTNALSAFDLNFVNGSFGSTNRLRSFSETDGTVTGTASANVPMTLMRLFGAQTKSIAVTCDGQMRIPNTDVMFVLDNSGSMACLTTESSCTNSTSNAARTASKISGLKVAIKCFYEALAKTDVTDVTPTQCGTTANPTGGLSTQVQLRFGFVNYDNMVNVGKLLPNDYMVDSASYQSRSPNYETIHAWTLGTPTTPTWSGWSPNTTPSSFQNTSSYGAFSATGKTGTTPLNGNSYNNKNTSGNNTATCNAQNTFAGGQLVAQDDVGVVGSPTSTPSDNNPPVFPASLQHINNSQNSVQTVTGLRYRWFKQGSNACWLEKATGTYTKTRTAATTAAITWTDYSNIRDWTYQQVSHDVSGLKAGGTSWNSSVDLPLNQANGPVVYPSGSSSPLTTKVVANTSVSWDGCIEERQTFPNTDGNGADDWGSHAWTGTATGASTPTTAIDMDIDRIPSTSDDNTRWKPLLVGAVWGRKDTLTSGTWGGNYTLNPVTSTSLAGTSNGNRNLSGFTTCVTESRKLSMYNGSTGAADLRDYVNTLYPNGNTYHDIGLIWGARLMSPTGIFASENATTPGGAQIQRHMIFMTDGDTANTFNNYASYGLEYWDHRQMQPGSVNTVTQQTTYENLLEANNNARKAALCSAIKNQNIKVWVISYGGGASSATNLQLQACATGSNYYFTATTTASLVTQFRQIADKISNLRLTN